MSKHHIHQSTEWLAEECQLVHQWDFVVVAAVQSLGVFVTKAGGENAYSEQMTPKENDFQVMFR